MTQSEIENYGPQGVEIYSDLKTALKIEEGVYKLDLSYKMLEAKLWSKIGKLKNLQALQLAANTGEIELPEDFSKLTQLVYFYSVGNAFKKLPDLINFPNLMYIELMGTKVDSLPNNIAYLQRLKILKFTATEDTLKVTRNLKYLKALKYVTIESVILDSCPKEFFKIENLKSLTLRNCKIKALPENLDKMKNLETLVLDNNNLTEIPRSIYKLKKLTALSLRGNKLTKIPDTICHLQNLSVLDLRGNKMDPSNLEEIQILSEGCKIIY